MTDLFDPRWKVETLDVKAFGPWAPPPLTDEEKDEVWRTYREGRPTRVPVLLATNSRVALGDARVCPGDLTFENTFTGPVAMLKAQLLWQYLCRQWYHRLCDYPADIPEKWTVGVQFYNSSEAMFFGCPVDFQPDQVPDTRPILTDDNKHSIFDIDITRPLDRPPFSTIVNFYDSMVQYVKDKTFLGRPIAIDLPDFTATDGPLTVAMNVRGPDILADLMDDPEYAHELFRFFIDATLHRRKAFIDRYNLPVADGWMADDSIAMIGVEQYKEMLLPHHRYWYESIGSQHGKRGIHLCGDATRHFPTLHRELGITSFDTGFPVTFTWLRTALGPDVEILGGVEVGLLLHGTPEQVYARARGILTSGILSGGRFVLREANNLPPCVPWENLAAMYKAAFDFGKY